MKIVIIGGSGLVGSKLVDKLRRQHHEVISASRETGINTLTGEGLNEALTDTDVVVDVANFPSFRPQALIDDFQQSTLNLLSAEVYAGVKHHIVLSVVGADRLTDSPYMRAKVAQEELIKASGVPFTILRSTPFFELAGRIANAGTINDQVRISPVAFQPIAADEVAGALADIAQTPPVYGTIEIAGPVCMPLYELIRYYLNATEDSRQLVEDEHARYYGAKLNDGSLVPGRHALTGKIKYESWFRSQLEEQRAW